MQAMVASMIALSQRPPRDRHRAGDPPTTIDGRVDAVSIPVTHPDQRPCALFGRLVAGRYRLRSLLGRGGMGRVFLADDELLHRPVAVKQPMGDGAIEETNARVIGEAGAAARVDHDGVVRILDVVSDGGVSWIVMEALSGRTLAEAVAAGGPLSIAHATRLGLRLLDILEAVHRADVVHRDVKPSNVHICADGRVVLTDFGIATGSGEQPNTPPGTFVGSPPYISRGAPRRPTEPDG